MVNNQPLVSVIMPCYNDGKYIAESVASLSGQTYSNLELIIIDDGSDDPETVAALDKIAFPKLKVLHTNHVGPAGARNCGIAQAKGVYILPLDADDTIDPSYIAKAVAVM
ncbi:MAG: glycosyltransferase family 2 protein, partial [Clostridia bacterium]|nr:glycosyltransferase family 2 protein [Clostridia bacterium]